jgi:hypothetical protein
MALFLVPSFGLASTVYEGTGWITGTEGVVVDFTADTSPYTYEATLSDLSVAPYFGFDFLFLSISSSTELIDSILGPGSMIFDATPGQKLFANIFGTGGGQLGAGNYGLRISSVPVPSALLLLGTGLLALIGIKRRNRP